jgi:3'5'-cyclic nucleotide phosphodiesterase
MPAILYKNRSVTQQNSFYVAWAVLMDSDFDQLRSSIYGNSRVEFQRFRQLLIRCVLATDVSDPTLTASRHERWERAFNGMGGGGGSGDDNLKAAAVLEAISQAADVAHAMQHWITFCKWSEREFKERRRSWCCPAGKVGSAHGSTLPSNGSLDELDAPNHWHRYQLRVLDDHVIPLARRLNESGVFGPNSRELLCWAVENRREWERHGPALVDRMVLVEQPQHRDAPPSQRLLQGPPSPPRAKRSKPERRRSSCSGVSSGARTYTSHSSS